TPLVDVAFLLLTFFMLTTSMSRPQTMEINLPPNDVIVEIPEHSLITIRVNEKGDLFWNYGIETPAKLEFVKLRGFIRQELMVNPRLVTLVKIEPKAKYEMMVNIMDELNQADMQRFSVAKFEDKDYKALANIQS
ncbi:MAG: biopolymer transporter ExbD, partial [Ignavibacteriae bacterium]|nr:biopolymer transporter ExbD [Ignavibacteriota bacterium]